MANLNLKYLAQELGLSSSDGIFYGEYRGYMISLKKINGLRALTIAAYFPDEESKQPVLSTLNNVNDQSTYRVHGFYVTSSMVRVNFPDAFDSNTYIKEYLDFLISILTQSGIGGINVCSCCGRPFENEPQVKTLINDGVFCMHEGCEGEMARQSSQMAQAVKDAGNMGTGVLGAAVGGVIGAIPWAIVGYFGWFVGWLGFLIGIAAKKGYEIGKGRETKAKGITIIVVVICAVILAELAGIIVSLTAAYMEYGAPLGDAIVGSFLILPEVVADSEVLPSVLFDIGLGLVFAFLGVFSTLRQIFAETKYNTSAPKRVI